MILFKHLYRQRIKNVRNISGQGLPKNVAGWLESMAVLCDPQQMHICDGTIEEREGLVEDLICGKTMSKLHAYTNCFLVRTDKRDNRRPDRKSYITGFNAKDWVPATAPGLQPQLGNFIDVRQAQEQIDCRFPKCMKGRKMYVIPFKLGPPGCKTQMLGIQLTDSPLTVLLSSLLTRVGREAMDEICKSDGACIYKGIHSTGREQGQAVDPPWPSNVEDYIMLYLPEKDEIWSYGSGFGGNAILTKKAIPLKMASLVGKREGWLAEHMAVLGIEKCGGPRHYIGIMGPSGVGKTTLASMLTSRLPSYKVTMFSDDVTWLRPSPKTNKLHAFNPSRGMFSIVPGMTWYRTPGLMTANASNTVYINTACTGGGTPWWEGLECPRQGPIIDWMGQEWGSAAVSSTDANARMVARLCQVVTLDPAWECPEGVPLSAILVASRRSEGVPLVYETCSFGQGVLAMAMLRTHAYPDSDNQVWELINDPFGMGPYLGYNFAHYVQQWFNLPEVKGLCLPRIFGINLYRQDLKGDYTWPGFTENIRVLDWVYNRLCGCRGDETPIGSLPFSQDFNMNGLPEETCFSAFSSFDCDFWAEEVTLAECYFEAQMTTETPPQLTEELCQLKQKLGI